MQEKWEPIADSEHTEASKFTTIWKDGVRMIRTTPQSVKNTAPTNVKRGKLKEATW